MTVPEQICLSPILRAARTPPGEALTLRRRVAHFQAGGPNPSLFSPLGGAGSRTPEDD